jgi:hypothetical protein
MNWKGFGRNGFWPDILTNTWMEEVKMLTFSCRIKNLSNKLLCFTTVWLGVRLLYNSMAFGEIVVQQYGLG